MPPVLTDIEETGLRIKHIQITEFNNALKRLYPLFGLYVWFYIHGHMQIAQSPAEFSRRQKCLTTQQVGPCRGIPPSNNLIYGNNCLFRHVILNKVGKFLASHRAYLIRFIFNSHKFTK